VLYLYAVFVYYFVCACICVISVFFVFFCVVFLYSFLLRYFDTVGWVFFNLTCKNRLPYNLYCVGVGGDVKHCSINQSIQHCILQVED